MRDGWELTPLGEVATQWIEPFTVDPGETYVNLGVQWYGQGVFQREPKLGSEMKATRLFRVRPGQFIYNRMFVTEGSFGVIREEHSDGVVSNEFPVFDIDQTRALPEYVNHYFGQPEIWRRVADEASGTTKSRRRWKEQQFLAHVVALPPLDEQKRIVDLIAAVDAAIEATDGEAESGLTLQRELRSVQFDGTVAERHSIFDVAALRLGKMLSKGINRGEDHPYLRNTNVQWDRIDTNDLKTMPFTDADREEFALRAGDVLVCEGGEVGRTAVVEEDMPGVYFQKAIHRVRCDGRLRPRYFAAFMRHAMDHGMLADYISGSTIKHLTREKLGTVRIPVPTIEEQDAFLRVLESARNTADAARATADALRTLRGNLLTALLSGEHEIPASYDRFLEEAA